MRDVHSVCLFTVLHVCICMVPLHFALVAGAAEICSKIHAYNVGHARELNLLLFVRAENGSANTLSEVAVSYRSLSLFRLALQTVRPTAIRKIYHKFYSYFYSTPCRNCSSEPLAPYNAQMKSEMCNFYSNRLVPIYIHVYIFIWPKDAHKMK